MPSGLSHRWSSWQLLPWQHFSALLCLLIMKMHKKTKEKCQKQRIHTVTVTVTTDWPTLTAHCLKAQLDVFEMLHMPPVLVLFLSAIYSHGKVCRSILQANPSLSSYIIKISHTVWISALVLKDVWEKPQRYHTGLSKLKNVDKNLKLHLTPETLCPSMSSKNSQKH